MVVKIKPSAPTMAGALGYNERKVSRDGATVVLRSNMDTERENCVRETFERFERLNIRSRDVCFHMSVNPGPGEKMDDGTAERFIADLMDRLGYGSQPYVIYRHNDIEREHFHVLSIRVNERGRKVNDFLEHRRCQAALRDLCHDYGYTVGGKEEAALAALPDGEYLCFNADFGNVAQQMEAVFEACLEYRYTSRRQFNAIAQDHALSMRIAAGKLSFQGLDSDGRKCTVPCSNPTFLVRYLDRMQECNEQSPSVEDLQRVGAALVRELPQSRSEGDFIRLMLGHGIHPSFDKNTTGKITGATYVDHLSRTAYDSNDFGHAFTLSDVQQAQREQWQEDTPSHRTINIGEMLISLGHNSKSREKDPKRKKRRPVIHI